MSFDIYFDSSKRRKKIYGLISREGTIRIGDFCEGFVAPLSTWNEDDYKNQWIRGIGKLLRGDVKSCLVVSYPGSKFSHSVIIWSMFREKKEIFLRNNLLFITPDEEQSFIRVPQAYVTKRIQFNEEGDRISEWRIGIDDLENFFTGHK